MTKEQREKIDQLMKQAEELKAGIKSLFEELYPEESAKTFGGTLAKDLDTATQINALHGAILNAMAVQHSLTKAT